MTGTANQPLNAASGAVHAAGWAQPDGTLSLIRKDVGRHNALDKLVGAATPAQVVSSAGFIVVTSRASFENGAEGHGAVYAAARGHLGPDRTGGMRCQQRGSPWWSEREGSSPGMVSVEVD